MRLLAIDPGTEESAWLVYDTVTQKPVDFAIEKNDAILDDIRTGFDFGFRGLETEHLAVEMIASYGMSVGKEVFETVLWIGRFIEAAKVPHTLVYRKDVKLHLCASPRANDANIRQALIDKFGPGKDVAVGSKVSPGPLYGISKHSWSALAVAVTWSDKNPQYDEDERLAA